MAASKVEALSAEQPEATSVPQTREMGDDLSAGNAAEAAREIHAEQEEADLVRGDPDAAVGARDLCHHCRSLARQPLDKGRLAVTVPLTGTANLAGQGMIYTVAVRWTRVHIADGGAWTRAG